MPHWTTSRFEYGQFVAPVHQFGGTDVRYSAIFSVASNVRSWEMGVAWTDSGGNTRYGGIIRGTTSGDELVHADLTSSQFGAHLSPVPIGGWRFQTWTNATRTGPAAETLTGTRTDRLPGSPPDIAVSAITLAGARITWLPSLRLRSAAGTPTSSANIADAIRIGTTDYDAEYDRSTRRYAYTATGLAHSTAYAVAAGGGTASFTTLAPVVYPAPTSRRTAVSATSATYAFDLPVGGRSPALEVEVGGAWRRLTGSSFTIGAGTPAWNPALAASDAGTAYSFRARWVNADGPTNGTAATITGSTRSRIPEAPQSLAASASLSDASFTWSAPSDAADLPQHYEYALRTAEVADLTTLARDGTIDAPAVTYLATGLRGFARYWFYLRAVNVAGASAWSSITATTTAQAEPNSTSVTLTWTEIAGLTYELRTQQAEWRAAESPHVLYGLAAGTLVEIELRALWRGSPGPAASIEQLTLPPRPAVGRLYAWPAADQAQFLFDPGALGPAAHPITIICSITGTDDAGDPISVSPTVTLDVNRFWTWAATGDFVGNRRPLTITFSYRNATGSGPAESFAFSLQPGTVEVTPLEVTSSVIRVGVPSGRFAGTGQTLQYQLDDRGWVDAAAFDATVGDTANVGARWSGLSANTRYVIKSRLVAAPARPGVAGQPGPEGSLEVYTAPATPTGITVSRRGRPTLPSGTGLQYYFQARLRDGSWSPTTPKLYTGGSLNPISNWYRFYASRISYGSVRVYSAPTGAILTT